MVSFGSGVCSDSDCPRKPQKQTEPCRTLGSPGPARSCFRQYVVDAPRRFGAGRFALPATTRAPPGRVTHLAKRFLSGQPPSPAAPTRPMRTVPSHHVRGQPFSIDSCQNVQARWQPLCQPFEQQIAPTNVCTNGPNRATAGPLPSREWSFYIYSESSAKQPPGEIRGIRAKKRVHRLRRHLHAKPA